MTEPGPAPSPTPSGERRAYFHLQLAAHNLRRIADQGCLRAAGITSTQAGLLFALEATPGITQREIAALLGQGEPAVAGMVRRLEVAGLIERTVSAEDRRRWDLALTGLGRGALAKVTPALAELNAAIDAAGTADVHAFVDLLEALERL